MRIVMVCTGNICRSPMAEALMKSALQKRGLSHIEVLSAGTDAYGGELATEEAQEVMREYGLDMHRHRARRISAKLLDGALALCMTPSHVRAVKAVAPTADVHLLREYAGEAGGVADPYCAGIFAYRRAAAEISSAVEKIADDLYGKMGG